LEADGNETSVLRKSEMT